LHRHGSNEVRHHGQLQGLSAFGVLHEGVRRSAPMLMERSRPPQRY
jgi:hypothetical protein